MTVARILDVKGHLVFAVPEGAQLKAVIDNLARHRVGALIVTNDSHEIVGIVSERDVIRCLSAEVNAMQRTAREIMTRDVLTCGPDESVEDVALRMVSAGIRHMPVCSGDELVGVISARDVLRLRA